MGEFSFPLKDSVSSCTWIENRDYDVSILFYTSRYHYNGKNVCFAIRIEQNVLICLFIITLWAIKFENQTKLIGAMYKISLSLLIPAIFWNG